MSLESDWENADKLWKLLKIALIDLRHHPNQEISLAVLSRRPFAIKDLDKLAAITSLGHGQVHRANQNMGWKGRGLRIVIPDRRSDPKLWLIKMKYLLERLKGANK